MAALCLRRGRACQPPRTRCEKHSEHGEVPARDQAAEDPPRAAMWRAAGHLGQRTLLMMRSATAYRSLRLPLSLVAPATVALTVTRPSEAASDAMLTG